MPRFFSAAERSRMRLYAPRNLYERTTCRSSRFRYIFAPNFFESPRLNWSGVSFTTPRNASRASSTIATSNAGFILFQ